MDRIAQVLLALHNSARVRPLVVSPLLTAAAAGWAREMAATRWMRHGNTSRRIWNSGFRGRAWAENIAAGYPDAASVFAAWMGDPGHREDVQSPLYTSVGFGYAADARGTIYWVADFGG